MQLSEKQLARLEEKGWEQVGIVDKLGYTPEHIIQFSTEDRVIIHPTMTECLRESVNPVEYYGEAFLQSDFMKLI